MIIRGNWPTKQKGYILTFFAAFHARPKLRIAFRFDQEPFFENHNISWNRWYININVVNDISAPMIKFRENFHVKRRLFSLSSNISSHEIDFSTFENLWILRFYENFCHFRSISIQNLTFWSGSEPLEVLCWIWDWYIWDVRFRFRFFGVIFEWKKNELKSQFWDENQIGNSNGQGSGLIMHRGENVLTAKFFHFWKLMSI